MLAAVYAADGLLLATPVYYEDVSAQMKAFIDRNVYQYHHDVFLTPKVVGLLVVTAETGSTTRSRRCAASSRSRPKASCRW